jgi:hypothetical protein
MMELEKLTLFPNNYHTWVPKFIMLASGISAPIALNLGDKDELNIDFLLDGISSKLLENLSTKVVFETKEATGRADISVDSIRSSTQSGPVVDRLTGLLLDGMVRLQRERSLNSLTLTLTLRDLKKNGTIESLKAARKKPTSNNQRRSYVSVAGSAGTPGGLLTLDTGSNVNVFSSRELFST